MPKRVCEEQRITWQELNSFFPPHGSQGSNSGQSDFIGKHLHSSLQPWALISDLSPFLTTSLFSVSEKTKKR